MQRKSHLHQRIEAPEEAIALAKAALALTTLKKEEAIEQATREAEITTREVLASLFHAECTQRIIDQQPDFCLEAQYQSAMQTRQETGLGISDAPNLSVVQDWFNEREESILALRKPQLILRAPQDSTKKLWSVLIKLANENGVQLDTHMSKDFLTEESNGTSCWEMHCVEGGKEIHVPGDNKLASLRKRQEYIHALRNEWQHEGMSMEKILLYYIHCLQHGNPLPETCVLDEDVIKQRIIAYGEQKEDRYYPTLGRKGYKIGFDIVHDCHPNMADFRSCVS